MAQSTQSTPVVGANISGTTHHVNLRDWLNMRVAPFLKKAITESLDASPEFPLQWLGEHLIHQSMLYEGNPDSTKIKERFLYTFDKPAVASVPVTAPSPPSTYDEVPNIEVPPVVAAATMSVVDEPPIDSEPVVMGDGLASEVGATQDAIMSNHVNGITGAGPSQQVEETRDTEMEGTS